MIRFVFRWAFRLLVLAIVLIVAAVLLKDAILKSALESRIQTEMGVGAKIGKFELGLLTPTITIENCVLYNPSEFGGSPFLELPELHVQYDRAALGRSDLHLTLVRLRLKELNIVENERGETNIVNILAGLEKTQAAGNTRARTNAVPDNFKGIDTLNLSVDSVNYISALKPQRNRHMAIGLTNEILHHVRSAQDLSPLLLKTLFRVGFPIFSQQGGLSEVPFRPASPRLPAK